VVHALNRPLLKPVLLLVCALSLLAISLTPYSRSSPEAASFDVKIVHFVDVRESSLLVVNDTVTLSCATGESPEPVQDFVLGFPFSYGGNLVQAFAHEGGNQSLRLGLDLNTGIGRIGFYGVTVNFEPAVNIGNDDSYQFSVVFVFDGSVTVSVLPIEETTVTYYNASFPAYPSLQYDAPEVDVKVAIPATLEYKQSSYGKEGITFTNTTEGSKRIHSFTKSNLTAFSDQSGWVYASRTGGSTQFLGYKEVVRQIEILSNQQIDVSDTYKVLNKAGELTKINLRLPKGAYAISASDELGLIEESNLATEQLDEYTNTTLTFTSTYEENDEIHFSVSYNLRWEDHVTREVFDGFLVSLSLFENPDQAIGNLAVTVGLPEGAVLGSSSTGPSRNSLQNAAFSTSFSFAFENATPFDEMSVSFAYQRPVFWESFRPTVWIGTCVFAVGALIAAWRAYRPPVIAPLPTAVTTVRADDLKSFVSNYDEKRRLLKDAEALEAAARKGKIPRRQYKVRKMTIDGRLSSVGRELAALRDKLRMAGPRYAELMRQLEVAETELQGAEAEIDRAEIRYRRGDLSPQAYHNVLETAYRRRDRAQTTTDGVLLRLREETG
jgi:hypothetical protein